MQTLNALHCGGFSRAVRPNQAEDLAVVDLERNLVDSHDLAVRLADSGDANDWMHEGAGNCDANA
jgi:hypothetical protein